MIWRRGRTVVAALVGGCALALISCNTGGSPDRDASGSDRPDVGTDSNVEDVQKPQDMAGDSSREDAPTDSATDGVAGSDAGDGGACPTGAAVADPFAGVWTGVQGNETFTFTNNAGCSRWTGSVGDTVCDVCTGTYVRTDAGVASATLQCRPVGACSTSPVHTDTGPYRLMGCSLTYDYDYGGGSNTFTAMRISDTTTNVCGEIDAGTD